MQETLHDHTTTISIGGRPTCNLCFKEDIDLMVGSNSELQELTNKLIATTSTYGMEISTVKSKVMVNSTNNASVSIIMDGKKTGRSVQLQILGSNPDKRWHMQNRNPYMDSHSHNSDGQTNKGMEE